MNYWELLLLVRQYNIKKMFCNQQQDTLFATEVVKLNAERNFLNFLNFLNFQPNAPTKIKD